MSAYADFARRGRNAWWLYFLALVGALVASIAVTFFVGLALALTGVVSMQTAAELQAPSRPLVFFPANGAVFGLLLLGFWAAVRLIQAKRFTDVTGRWTWSEVGKGAAVWLAVSAAAALIDLAIAPGGFRLSAGPGTAGLALAAMIGLSVQTFAEEWVFRGWVTQGALLATRRPLPAAVLAGLAFGAVHIPNGWPQAASATAFGVATSWIAIRRGGIAFTWGLHLVNNLFGAVVLVSSADVFRGAPGLFTQDTPGLMWWDVAVAAAGFALVAWRFGDGPAGAPAVAG